jgi:hypothetical protein
MWELDLGPMLGFRVGISCFGVSHCLGSRAVGHKYAWAPSFFELAFGMRSEFI